MMTISTNKPFTKSVFKTALSCPTKLYYARHPELYANSNDEDEFLAALAEGGFQVGELAKLYEKVEFDLHDVSDYTEALVETERLLARDKVVIAEAAFGVEKMFVRADIIRKEGKHIDLIEVKAKSFHPDDSWNSSRPKGSIKSGWREYLYDLAFQKYVIQLAFPDHEIHAYLMMADKSTIADIDNMNQLFKIVKNHGCTSIIVNPEVKDKLALSKVQVLTEFDANETVDVIIAGTTTEQPDFLKGRTFKQFVQEMCEAWTKDSRVNWIFTTNCFDCEFCCGENNKMKDGRDECWLAKAGFAPSRTQDAQLAEMWSQSFAKRNEFLKQGKYFLKDITFEDMPKTPPTNSQMGLSFSERRWLQIAFATQDKGLLTDFGDIENDDIYMDLAGMHAWMQENNVKPPYHMIDFETTAVALPYYKGLHPYEQVAFQFSHHIMEPNPDGSFSIRHAGQWLNEDVNKFPNFDFVRALKHDLEGDEGTIFRYSAHENTILNKIKQQLEESNEPDKEELIAFICSITYEKNEKNVIVRKGERSMVDLCDMVKKFYYCYSQMHGSNSIKKVLPAVLNSSQLLQDKYSQAIYGKEIPSLNISADKPIAWISRLEDGTIDNPYHQLPSVASYLGLTEEQVWRLEDSQTEWNDDDDMTVANGGAALTAYSKLMFCDDGKMDEALRTALLRYCELDTMAMVFIWEYFYHEIYN